MTIQLSERTVGLWFIQLEPKQDWLASVFTTPEGELKGMYRFRYYVDDKAFGSDDPKSWYEITTTKTISETVEKFRVIYNALVKQSGSPEHYEILMDEEGLDSFMEKFKKKSSFNGIELTKSEAKWLGYSKDG